MRQRVKLAVPVARYGSSLQFKIILQPRFYGKKVLGMSLGVFIFIHVRSFNFLILIIFRARYEVLLEPLAPFVPLLALAKLFLGGCFYFATHEVVVKIVKFRFFHESLCCETRRWQFVALAAFRASAASHAALAARAAAWWTYPLLGLDGLVYILAVCDVHACITEVFDSTLGTLQWKDGIERRQIRVVWWNSTGLVEGTIAHLYGHWFFCAAPVA